MLIMNMFHSVPSVPRVKMERFVFIASLSVKCLNRREINLVLNQPPKCNPWPMTNLSL